MTPGVSIAWVDVNPDTGQQEFEFIDAEDDVFVVWRSRRDGKVHATGFGKRVNRSERRFDRAASLVIDVLRLE